jgi:hypothetical protein
MTAVEWVVERKLTRQQWTTFIIAWSFITIKEVGDTFHHKFQRGNVNIYFQMDIKV